MTSQATRVPDETARFDFKHGAATLKVGDAAQVGTLPFLGTKLFKIAIPAPSGTRSAESSGARAGAEGGRGADNSIGGAGSATSSASGNGIGNGLFGMQGLVDLLNEPSPASQRVADSAAAAMSVSSGDGGGAAQGTPLLPAAIPARVPSVVPPSSSSTFAGTASTAATVITASNRRQLLRIEVSSAEKVVLRVRFGAPPSRFTSKTTVGKRTGYVFNIKT